MNKIPCIKCTPELWEYVKPYLKKWGYNIDFVTSDSFKTVAYLVLNRCATFGDCGSFELSSEEEYNREVVTDVEEFLKKAAKLKGFTYEKENIIRINGIEIKPGMVLTSNSREHWIVFPIKDNLAVVGFETGRWCSIDKLKVSIREIRDLSTGGKLFNGTVLWGNTPELVITMQDIAEKFNCRVEQIRIKE